MHLSNDLGVYWRKIGLTHRSASAYVQKYMFALQWRNARLSWLMQRPINTQSVKTNALIMTGRSLNVGGASVPK